MPLIWAVVIILFLKPAPAAAFAMIGLAWLGVRRLWSLRALQ
jgi:hypothetical protein